MTATDCASRSERRALHAWIGLAWLALALGLLFVLPLMPTGADLTRTVFAEDGAEDEEDPDLGDKKLPLADQINQAIERGVNWLLAKPELFKIPGARDDEMGAFYGRINSKTLYSGGTGPGYPHPAGTTALALYTLLKCGVSPKHPIIKKGFNWIRIEHGITQKWDAQDGQRRHRWDWTEAGGSYELSAMVLALTAKWDPHKKTAKSKGQKRKGKLKIKDVEDREWLQRMVDELIKRRGIPEKDSTAKGWRYNLPLVKKGNKKSGFWSRPAGAGAPPPNQDLSSTQLASLALYSAHRFGITMDPAVWYDIVDFTLAQQEKTGPEVERHMPGYRSGGYAVPKDKARGFCYNHTSTHRGEAKATGSMTACGVANLLMAREFLANHKKTRKKFLASELPKKIDTAIDDGLAWLASNWSSFRNPGSSYGYHIYYLYGIERCMDMRGKRLLGRHPWYEEGAKQLLQRVQKVEGVEVPKLKRGSETLPGMFWLTKSTHEPYDVLDTCFALLFLKRATWGMVPPPVVVTGD